MSLSEFSLLDEFEFNGFSLVGNRHFSASFPLAFYGCISTSLLMRQSSDRGCIIGGDMLERGGRPRHLDRRHTTNVYIAFYDNIVLIIDCTMEK